LEHSVAPFLMLKLIKNLFKKPSEKDIECAIDEQTVDCESEAFKQDALNYYTGVPAPNPNVLDEWFMSPYGQPLTSKKEEFAGNYQGPLYAPYTAIDSFKKETVGDDGMHQKMYDIATQNGNTTIQLNHIGGSENFQGGSENVHR